MEQQQVYAQPQFVVMPVPQRNGLGVFGFFVALVGLVIPTGIVALLGLILSLAAIGRSPRGFAAAGVILGLLGTVFWLVAMFVAAIVAVAAAAGFGLMAVAGFALTQPEVVEVTTDMVNMVIAVEEYREEHDDALPGELALLPLRPAVRTDPWGTAYRFVVSEDEDLGFDLVSGGPDASFDTEDDIALSRLGATWKGALATFERDMEDLGERLEHLERLEGRGFGSCSASTCAAAPDRPQPLGYASQYEALARESLRREAAPDPPQAPPSAPPAPLPPPPAPAPSAGDE